MADVGSAIGHAIPFGIAVALSPFPIIAMVLVLATPRGAVNGAALALGSLAGLITVGGGLLVIANLLDPSDGGDPADWVSVAKLGLAVVLIRLAVMQWRKRPVAGATPELPAWMATFDDITAARAAGMGVLLSAVNPKNLVLVIAAAAAIADTGTAAGAQAAGLAVFVALAMLGVTVPLTMSLLLGVRADPILAGVREWMARESATIMTAILILIAAKLVGDAVTGLTA